MSPKKYLATFLCLLLALSVLVITLNVVVDPYLVMSSTRYEGVNKYKVDINSRVRLSKAYQPLQYEFSTLIVGNSRVEMGLDPKNSCLSLSGGRSYNLGIPGASVGYQAASALNLLYQKPIDTILISVDFTDFLVLSRKNSSNSNYKIPVLPNALFDAHGHKNDSYVWAFLKDHFQALFSLDAALSSLQTLALQDQYAPNRTDMGFNPAMDFLKMTKVEGAGRLFLQKEKDLESKYMKGWGLYYRDGEISEDFSYLEELVLKATQKGVRVIVFTNPLHHRFWKIIKRAELIEQNSIFLEKIEEIINRSGNQKVDFWDFSGDSIYIREDVNTARNKGVGLKWFWEPAHYKKELGDLMIESMFAKECNTKEVFGRKITSSGL